MTEISKQVEDRMRRIGSKKNFMRESQVAEMEGNEKIVMMSSKTDKGIQNVDLILEPNQFDKLSSKVRLSFDEYCNVINELIEEEENEWHELRMKDQVNITRDAIINATIMKYALEEYGIKKENYSGVDVNYIKRYDIKGQFLGEAIVVTLTAIPMMGVRLN